jgi:hypothetical protein
MGISLAQSRVLYSVLAFSAADLAARPGSKVGVIDPHSSDAF